MPSKKAPKRMVKFVPIDTNPQIGTFYISFALRGEVGVQVKATMENASDIQKVLAEARKLAYTKLDGANGFLEPMEDFVSIDQEYILRYEVD